MKLNEILNQALSSNIDEQKVLYDFYVRELNEVLEAKKLLEGKEIEIRKKIELYSSNSSAVVFFTKSAGLENQGYPKNGSWRDKIDYFLHQNKVLTAKEVVTMIEDVEPELKGKITSSIYPTLSDNSKNGKWYIKSYNEKLKVNQFRLSSKNIKPPVGP